MKDFTKVIMVKGNPVDGFSFIGPYDSRAIATAAGDSVDTEWWIADLVPHDEDESDD